jgi:hypothetical protein
MDGRSRGGLIAVGQGCGPIQQFPGVFVLFFFRSALRLYG